MRLKYSNWGPRGTPKEFVLLWDWFKVVTCRQTNKHTIKGIFVSGIQRIQPESRGSRGSIESNRNPEDPIGIQRIQPESRGSNRNPEDPTEIQRIRQSDFSPMHVLLDNSKNMPNVFSPFRRWKQKWYHFKKPIFWSVYNRDWLVCKRLNRKLFIFLNIVWRAILDLQKKHIWLPNGC
jgi:hypothetical protein